MNVATVPGASASRRRSIWSVAPQLVQTRFGGTWTRPQLVQTVPTKPNFQASERAGVGHHERYADMFELIALGESLGFDVAWLAEIHFGGPFSLISNPLMVVPAIAERVPRIRIGTAVTLLVKGRPSFTRLRRISTGVLNLETEPDRVFPLGRLWVDEVRATPVVHDSVNFIQDHRACGAQHAPARF